MTPPSPSIASRPTFTCSVCGNVFRFYGEGDPAPDQTCLGCNPWFGNPANRTPEQNAKRAQLRDRAAAVVEVLERDYIQAQAVTNEQAAPVAEAKKREYEAYLARRDWNDIKGDCDL